MTALALNDLSISEELDSKAMDAVTGRGDWHKYYDQTTNGAWSGWIFKSSSYQGITYHDGYQVKHTKEGWNKTRLQTRVTFWDHYVRT